MAAAKKKAADTPLEDRPVVDLKKQAEKEDVDVEGSGKGGRVLKQDLVEALEDNDQLADNKQVAADRQPPEPPIDAHSNPDLEQPKRDEALERVREQNEIRNTNARFHNRTEVTHRIEGEDGEALIFQSVAGKVYVSATSAEVVLGKDAMIDLVRTSNTMHQAVS